MNLHYRHQCRTFHGGRACRTRKMNPFRIVEKVGQVVKIHMLFASSVGDCMCPTPSGADAGKWADLSSAKAEIWRSLTTRAALQKRCWLQSFARKYSSRVGPEPKQGYGRMWKGTCSRARSIRGGGGRPRLTPTRRNRQTRQSPG